jgi:hypothetical protein
MKGATAAVEGFSRLGARGDVQVALESGMIVLDVSVTNPLGVALRAASDGATAAQRDAEQRRAYNLLAPNGYTLALGVQLVLLRVLSRRIGTLSMTTSPDFRCK